VSGGLSVSGGVGGVEARFDDMRVVAAVLAQEGDALDVLGRVALRLLDAGDLLASALLCPQGAVVAQAQLLDAVAGPDGLVVAVVGLRATSLKLEAAADLYAAKEEALADLVSLRRQLAGMAVGMAVGTAAAEAPVLFAGTVTAGVAAFALVTEVEPVRDGLLGSGMDLLEEHPGLVDEGVGSLPGVISGLARSLPWVELAYVRATGRSMRPRTVEEAAGLLLPFLPLGRGRAVAVRNRAVAGGLTPERAPRGIGDLVAGVHRRSKESAEVPGLIAVREIPAVGGRTRSWVVDLPGTQVWDLRPGTNPRDLATNVQTIAGSTTAYQQAVVSALRAAKVPRREPVMLVGHSQGGLTAAALATDPQVRAEFRITHVVTAGSPVARIAVPPDVQVLSLENRRDIVPHFEGESNPPTAAWTTVVIDPSGETVTDHHGLASYLRGANKADAATGEPSVRGFLGDADDFLGVGAPMVVHRYQMLRDPP